MSVTAGRVKKHDASFFPRTTRFGMADVDRQWHGQWYPGRHWRENRHCTSTVVRRTEKAGVTAAVLVRTHLE